VSIVTVYGYGVTVFGYNRKGVEMGRTSELAPLGKRAVDTSTGEVLDLRERRGCSCTSLTSRAGRWFMAIQEAFVALAKDKSLRASYAGADLHDGAS
jgi:hypothetical protein